jgi:hypothetical protein
MTRHARTRRSGVCGSLLVLLAGLGTGLVAGLVACSGPETQGPARSLPFHVAVLPVQIRPEVGAAAPVGEDPPDVAEDLRLVFRETDVTAGLTAALREQCFVLATPLVYPESRDDFLDLPPDEQDRYWIQAAEEIGADLLVSAQFVYREGVRTDTNNSFWLNLPLFLLGGPMTWFVDDRSYFLDAELDVEVFELQPLVNETTNLDNQDARLQRIDSDIQEARLDFLDRADHAGHYALSIVWPSGWIATETEETAAELQQAMIDALVGEVVRKIDDQSSLLVQADGLVDFHVVPEDLRLTRKQDGAGYDLQGEVLLRRGRNTVQSMGVGRLEWGEDSSERVRLEAFTVDEAVGRGDSYLRYPFSFHLPAGELPDVARLTLTDGSADQKSRTYHLPLKALATTPATE